MKINSALLGLLTTLPLFTNHVNAVGDLDLSESDFDGVVKEFIVDFAVGAEQECREFIESLAMAGRLEVVEWLDFLGDVTVECTDFVATEVENHNCVVAVDEDFQMEKLGWEDEEQPHLDPHGRVLQGETVPYGIGMVRAAELPNLPADKSFKKICVVDTGYDNAHPDLPDLADTDGFDFYGEFWDVDGNGHGTHCAGTIGAIGNNGVGVNSVMNTYGSGFTNFHIGKGLSNSGGGSYAGVIAAMNDCGAKGADIISMSLGGGGFLNSFNDAAKVLWEQGVLLVAAAGNGGSSAFGFPASYDYIVSVASVTSSRTRSSFSQYNTQVEIAGPGSSVYSTYPNNSYRTLSGTSMATPHVAGVAGLVWSHFPTCKPMQIRYVLAKTAAHSTANTDCDIYLGHGIVDAKAAYDYLVANPCDTWGDQFDPTFVKAGCEVTTTISTPTAPTAPVPPTPAPTNPPTNPPTPAPTNPPTYPPTHDTRFVYSRDGTDTTTGGAQSYGGSQDHTGIIPTISDDGKTISLSGNVWKAFSIEPYEISFHTKLSFSAELIEAAEINAICLEENLVYSDNRPRCFSFGGTQSTDSNFVRLDYNTVGAGYKYYDVPVGQYYGTTINYIALMQDKDSSRTAGQSNIKDITLYEGQPFIIDVFGVPEEIEVIERYGGSQDHGYRKVDISDDGTSVTFRGNTWRAFAVDYEITRSTYISFQIDIDEIAEAVAVCLDENLVYGGATQDRYQCLAVSGTQDVSNDRNFQMLSPYLSAGESHTYLFRPSDLPVQLQGEYKYLSFMLDKDSARDDGIATLSNVKIFFFFSSCLATVSWSFTFDECSTTNLVPKLKETFDANCQGSANSFEVDLLEFFDGDAEKGIHELCDSAYDELTLTEMTLEEDQFIREYFDGGNTWNYEVDEKGEPISNSAARVKFAYDNLAQTNQVVFPDSHQFLNCELRSAMCCFVADRQANDNNGNCADGDCDDADPADNTDLCYVDMKRSQVSSRVRDGWSIYPGDTEGAVHCHGIAWGNNAGAEDQFKGNNLFYVSMYDHMYTRGYVEQVQGAPMCGCIEQMPVVSRSDCTQVDVTQSVTVSYDKDTTLLSAAGTITDIEFNSCQGADNNNNDLSAYYQQLVNDGKATAEEKAKFDTYVVGDDNCDAATTSFLTAKGLNYATTN